MFPYHGPQRSRLANVLQCVQPLNVTVGGSVMCLHGFAVWATSWIRIRIEEADSDPRDKNCRIFAKTLQKN